MAARAVGSLDPGWVKKRRHPFGDLAMYAPDRRNFGFLRAGRLIDSGVRPHHLRARLDVGLELKSTNPSTRRKNIKICADNETAALGTCPLFRPSRH